MPHLSPMNWIVISFILWISMSGLMSLIWWAQTPTFPTTKGSKKKNPLLPWS